MIDWCLKFCGEWAGKRQQQDKIVPFLKIGSGIMDNTFDRYYRSAYWLQ